MSWESDERDAALEKLDRIKQVCSWVRRRQLPAHRRAIVDIQAIIDGPDRVEKPQARWLFGGNF